MNRTFVTCMLWSAFGVIIHASHLDLTAPRTVFFVACAAIVLVMTRHAASTAVTSSLEPQAVDTFMGPCVLEPRYLLNSPVTISPYGASERVCTGRVQQWRDDGFELLSDGRMQVGEVAVVSVYDRMVVGIVSQCFPDHYGYAISLELFYSIKESRVAPRELETKVAVA
jgi:hypothetical protein